MDATPSGNEKDAIRPALLRGAVLPSPRTTDVSPLVRVSAANIISRFKSTWRSFSQRMVVMIIMHEPYAMASSSLDVYLAAEEGEFNATRKRFAGQAGNYPRWILRDRTRGRGTGIIAGSQGRNRSYMSLNFFVSTPIHHSARVHKSSCVHEHSS